MDVSIPSPTVSTMHILVYSFTDVFYLGESSGKLMNLPESFETPLLIKFPSRD